MKFFTADTHFNHKTLLNLGLGRPFNDIIEHDETIISNWNKKVSNKDDVYVLGDMFWGMNEYQIQSYMDRLKGHKHLIIGNHDKIGVYVKSNRFVEITQYKEIEVNDKPVILNHFPLAEWDGFYYGSYHLYGHTHGTFNLASETLKRKRPNGNCWDVGVDNNNYEPVSMEEIIEKIDKNIKDITDEKDI